MRAFYERGNRPDPGKPNHYFHDALGDPYDCTGDHNHPARVPSEFMRRLAQLFLCFVVGGACTVVFLVVYALAETVL